MKNKREKKHNSYDMNSAQLRNRILKIKYGMSVMELRIYNSAMKTLTV